MQTILTSEYFQKVSERNTAVKYIGPVKLTEAALLSQLKGHYALAALLQAQCNDTNYLMLCLVGVNDSGRNGMKNELYYGQLLTNFIPSSIPFLTLCTRDHTFNLRWNAPFSPTPNFFSNLIIAILPHLHLFQNFLPISISFK